MADQPDDSNPGPESDERHMPQPQEPTDEAEAERSGTDGGLAQSSDDAEELEETMSPDADSMTTFFPHGLRIN